MCLWGLHCACSQLRSGDAGVDADAGRQDMCLFFSVISCLTFSAGGNVNALLHPHGPVFQLALQTVS